MNRVRHNIRFRADLPKVGLPATFHIISACSPGERAETNAEVKRGKDELRNALQAEGLFFFPVIVGSPDFRHGVPGFGVLFSNPAQALAWGRRFRNEAVFQVSEGLIQHLPCDGGNAVEIGAWDTLAEPEACKPVFRHLGNPLLLNLPKTALFASTKCPGSVILPTYDQAARWREQGRCIISGFHSPIEKECLTILLRGTSPVIVCPARSLRKRLPSEWKSPLEEGRMLILSPFEPNENHQTAKLATRRNEYVAALADDIWLAHATEGGKLQKSIGCRNAHLIRPNT